MTHVPLEDHSKGIEFGKRLAARVPAALSVLLILAVAACDSDESVGPSGRQAVRPPGGLALEAPVSVVEGQPFTLIVRALDAEGDPDPTWSGKVALAASAGAISPDTVEVDGGAAEFEARLSGYAGDAMIVARSGGVEASAAVRVLGTAAPARIEVTPGSVLLPGQGATQALTAEAYDAQDRPVVAAVTWRSADPTAVQISADGVATAAAAVGSAQITAEAGGVVSEPALALVARPAADDALLVPDSQVVSGIQPADPAAPYGIGWRYRVTLRGVDSLAVGRLVIGTGEAPLAGRVVEVSGAGEERQVTLELVPVGELFRELTVRETIPLSTAGAQISPQSQGRYRLERRPDGTLRATPLSPSAFVEPERVRPLAEGETEFALGPFECTATGAVPDLDIPSPSYTITPDLSYDLAYDGGLERLAIRGSLDADLAFEPVFETQFEGEVGCEAEIVTLRLPIPGPLGLFFGGQVPLGVGVDLEAALSLGEVGFRLSANASGDLEAGVACPGGGACAMLQRFEPTADGAFEFVYPDGTNDLRVELGGYGHAFAALAIGSNLSDNLQLELVKATAGLKQSVDLATAEGQAADTAYASGYALALKADVGPGG